MSLLYTLLVGDGTRVTRPLKLLAHDRRATRCSSCARSRPRGWSRRTIIVLVHADARQRDRAACPKRDAARRRAAADRAGPRAAEPDVHPGRQPVRRVAREAHGRDRAELGHGGGAQHPEHRPHPRRRRDRRRPVTRRGRRPPARVRLREPARLRRRGDPGQRRREPEPDHHRAGRARDEPRAAGAISRRTSRRARRSRTPRGSA